MLIRKVRRLTLLVWRITNVVCQLGMRAVTHVFVAAQRARSIDHLVKSTKGVERRCWFCIAPCGFCHMQLLVTAISVDYSQAAKPSDMAAMGSSSVPGTSPGHVQVDIRHCIHLCSLNSTCRDIEAQEDKGKWTCAQMQGGATCRSSQGDWGAALRKKATQLRHQNNAASHSPQVCLATILCMQTQVAHVLCTCHCWSVYRLM